MKKQIPNIITLCNLFSGCIAITMAFTENFVWAFIWVLIAATFDFFDGFVARLLKVSSKIGVELDSLADVVSFGVAPGTIVFVFLREYVLYPDFLSPMQEYIPFFAFLIPAFSAYRLAKFNIDTRQSTSFLGLPTPANGLFWISYVCGICDYASGNELWFYLTVGLIFVLSIIMISEIPMFSLKIKEKKLKSYIKQITLIVVIITFVSLWGIIGFAWGILVYIAISILSWMMKSNR